MYTLCELKLKASTETRLRHETGLKVDLRETELQRSQKTKNDADEVKANKDKCQTETKKIGNLLMVLKAIVCVLSNVFGVTDD